MTPNQVELVKKTWGKIDDRENFAILFYERLFAIDPSVKPLFKSDLKQQGQRLIQMLNTAVNGLDRLVEIGPGIEDLGKRHRGYGVKMEYYKGFGAALLLALEQRLGEVFTTEVHRAWAEAYEVMAGIMKNAAAQSD